MASKAAQPEAEKADIEELLDTIDKTLDRTKVLYEQYFLGMQKQPPTQIHTDCERRLRDLQQMQIRNTGLRYRFATLQQKFGSYNSYWRRTLKQIENGTYIRNLQKISRQAALTGDAIPEEILAAMPKRMREQVKRDREQALSIAKRRQDTQNDGTDEFLDDDAAVMVGEAPEVVRQIPRGGAHVLADDDADLDFEAFFASVENKADDTQENIPAYQDKPAPAPRAPTPRQAPVAARPSAPVLRHELSVDDDESTTFEPPRAPAPRPSAPALQRGAVPPPARPNPGVPPVATQSPPAGGPQFPRGATQPGAVPPAVPQRATGPIPAVPAPRRSTGPMPAMQATTSIPTIVSQSGSMPTLPGQSQPIGTFQGQTQPIPTMQPTQRLPTMPDPQRATGPIPVQRTTGSIPTIPNTAIPSIPPRPGVPSGGIPRPGGAPAPSQVSRPNPIAPGSSTARPVVPVETMQGPFPRAQPPPPAARTAAPPVHARQEPPKVAPPRPQPATPRPPPGMSEADVNALHATYVKAKKAVGEEAGPGSYGKLLQTINAQAPKIMEQYKAKGVEFTVVVKDNQVVIKAKPKT